MLELCNELKYRIIRKKVHDDKYGIVGVEIRDRRKSSDQTQEALSQDVCSISYLCKVEKNQIEPNKAFLRELCSRLDLTEDKVDYLFELRDVLYGILRAYIIGDIGYIAMCSEHGEGFENYRYKIIKMINKIAHYEFDGAYELMNKIMPLLSSMCEFDLTIFTMFSSILLYYRFEFKEALDNLVYLDDFNICSDLKVLKGIVLFKIHYALNKADTPYWYDNAKMLLFEHGYYNNIDELKYVLGLYYIKNGCDDAFDIIKKDVANKNDRNSLNAINSFINDNNLTPLMNFNDTELNEYAKMLKKVLIDSSSINEIIKREPNYYQIGFDYVFLEYQASPSLTDKFEYIFNIGLPKAQAYSDDYLKRFFISEIARMPIHINKNRALVRAFVLAYGKGFNLSEFEVLKYDD